MGIFAIILGILWLVHLDASSMRWREGGLYDRTLKYDPGEWVLLFVFLAPIYLLRRSEFLKELKTRATVYLEQPSVSEAGSVQEAQAEGRLSGFSVLRRPTLERFWDLMEVDGVLLFWFTCVAWIYVLYELFNRIFKFSWSELEEMLFFSIFVLLFLVWVIYTRAVIGTGQSFRSIFCLRRNGQSNVRLFFFPFLSGLGLAIVSSFVLMARPEIPQTPLNEVLIKAKSPDIILMFFMMAVLLAPFFEEIIFRGYFYSALRLFKGPLFSVLLIAGIFTFLHVGQYWGDWLAILIVGVLGVVLTLWREKSGSSIPSITLHYTYNLFVILIPAVWILSGVSSAFLRYQAFYDQLGPAQKEELLLKSIAARPEFTPAYNDLAWLYAQENRDLPAALELIEKALLNDPQNEAYLDTKAEVLYQLHRFDEAIAIEEDLVRRFPDREILKDQLKKFRERGP